MYLFLKKRFEFAAEDTMTMCKRALENMLVTQFDYTEADAHAAVQENWIGGMSVKGGGSEKTEKVFPIGDVLLLFKVLRKFNIRVSSAFKSDFFL